MTVNFPVRNNILSPFRSSHVISEIYSGWIQRWIQWWGRLVVTGSVNLLFAMSPMFNIICTSGPVMRAIFENCPGHIPGERGERAPAQA